MKKRFLSLILALAMMVGVFTPLLSSAAEANETKVRIHKILMDEDAYKEWPKDGKKHDGSVITNIQEYFGAKAKAINGVAFRIYKVYTGEVKENETPAGYTKGDKLIAGHKLATGDLDPNKFYQLVQVEGRDFVLSKNDGKEDGIAEVTLADGTYRVVEDKANSTYKGEKGETLTGAKAVPFDLVLPAGLPDGTGNYSVEKPLNVYPKNVEKAPKIDKNFKSDNGLEKVEDKNSNINAGAKYENYDKEKATAKVELGKKVPYEVKTQIPAEAKYKKLVWTDQMTEGLTYNKDLKVMLGTTKLTEYKSEKEPGDYKVISTDRGFTLKFTDAGLTKVENAAKTAATEITLTYSATVNANAIPGKVDANDVALDYSNKPGKDSEPKEGKPNNGEIKVEKSWAVDGNAVTDADKTVKALFTLQEKQENGTWKDVESYEATAAENFKHTFTGLDNKKTYRVVEQVSGYEAEYVSFENGVAVIKNNKDKSNPNPLNPTEPKVVTGGKKFVKTNADGSERLSGAEFKIKKNVNGEDKFLKGKDSKDIQKTIAEYKAADKAYKDAVEKLTQKEGVITYPEGVTTDSIKTLKEARDKAFEAANITYEWGTEAEASVFKSNEKGQVEVIGLEYGKYTLVETKAPAGYALPTDGGNFTFTVTKDSYTKDNSETSIDYVADSKAQDAMQIKNNKVTIPQTGGIGTIIFTAIGLAIMASAIIAIKKRQATEAR